MRTYALVFKKRGTNEWGDKQLQVSMKESAIDMPTALKFGQDTLVELVGEEKAGKFQPISIIAE